MRILLCIHHHLDAETGAPGLTLRLGSAYEALGHDVTYLSFDDLPARVPALAAELLFPEFAAGLLARRANTADLVDATTGDAWLWARLARSGTRPALVTRSHGLEHVYWQSAVTEARARRVSVPLRSRLYHGGWRLREVAASLRAADACVFSNGVDRDFAIARLGVPAERAFVVLNAIPDEFKDLQLTEPDGAPGVAMIGSWESRKGSLYAADSLAPVLGRHRDLTLSLLGTRVPPAEVLGAFPPDVHSQIRVVASYRRDELPGLLAESQVLVSASLAEGFSVAIPEGMAAGLAPVATALPGSAEIVRDEQNGLLVPPADARALESAVERLVEDRLLLARLRLAAHADAQDLTQRSIAERNLDVYERASRRVRGAA